MTDTINAADAVESIAALADTAAGQTPVVLKSTGRNGDEDDLLVILRRDDQHTDVIDLSPYLPAAPRRKSGRVTLDDPASFVTYVLRHVNADETTLWSSVNAGTITAVLDDYASDGAELQGDNQGRAGHRSMLQLRTTPDWDTWLKYDGKLMTQAQFAEFLVDNAGAIRDPAPTEFLAVARTFTAKRDLKFKSGTHLQSGEVQFEYDETIGAKAGTKGELTIPDEFEVGLVPFEGGQAFALTANFRYRLTDDGLGLGYRLQRPDLVRQAAFDAIATEVASKVGLPVLAGTPRP